MNYPQVLQGALHCAVFLGFTEMVKVILNAINADVNLQVTPPCLPYPPSPPFPSPSPPFPSPSPLALLPFLINEQRERDSIEGEAEEGEGEGERDKLIDEQEELLKTTLFSRKTNLSSTESPQWTSCME